MSSDIAYIYKVCEMSLHFDLHQHLHSRCWVSKHSTSTNTNWNLSQFFHNYVGFCVIMGDYSLRTIQPD